MTAKKTKVYGDGFRTIAYAALDRYLTCLQRGAEDSPDATLPSYEAFIISDLWYNAHNGRWPHLSVTGKSLTETAGILLHDWSRKSMMTCCWFDIGPFQMRVGLRVPVALKGACLGEMSDEVFIGIFTNDQQCIADYMNDESKEFLSHIFNAFPTTHLLDFESDPFFYCKVPHTKGLMAYCRLLDHLESVYSANSTTHENDRD